MGKGMAEAGPLALMRKGLVDAYVLLIHPLLLGRGRRLFGDDAPCSPLRLVDSVTTTKAVVIATYHSDGDARTEAR